MNYTVIFWTCEFKIASIFEEHYVKIRESYFENWVESTVYQGKRKSICMKFIWLKKERVGKTEIWRVKQFSTPTYTSFATLPSILT